MIGYTSRSEHWNPMIPPNPGKVFPEPRKQFVRDEAFALFSAEHKMNEHIRILMRHCANIHIPRNGVCAGYHNHQVPSLNGTRVMFDLYPAFPCRAFQY